MYELSSGFLATSPREVPATSNFGENPEAKSELFEEVMHPDGPGKASGSPKENLKDNSEMKDTRALAYCLCDAEL